MSKPLYIPRSEANDFYGFGQRDILSLMITGNVPAIINDGEDDEKYLE